MKKYCLLVCITLLPLFSVILMFSGLETQHREHNTDYKFFVKQEPSFQMFFINPFVCGECDVEIYEVSPLSRIQEIANYCRQRFGLSNLRMCHAIFAESQRQAHSATQNLGAITQVATNFINKSNIENKTNFSFPSMNDKIIVPECMLPLSAKWRDDADGTFRIDVSCEKTNRSSPQNRWTVTLQVISNEIE